MNLLRKQKQRQNFGYGGKDQGEEKIGNLELTCIHCYFKTDNQQGPRAGHREPYPVFCNNLNGQRA